MPEEVDWSVTSFDGNRRRQFEEFAALPFREKLDRIEQMGRLVERFGAERPGGLPPTGPSPSSNDTEPGASGDSD